MKNEIKCPKCGTVFQIDESDYESILKQIRNHEYLEDIAKKEEDLLAKQAIEIDLVKAQMDSSFKSELSKKDEEYNKLLNSYNELNNNLNKESQTKEKELNDALNSKDIEIATLKQQLSAFEELKNSAIKEAVSKEKENNQNNILKITNLENEIKNIETENKLAMQEAISEKDKEISKLSNDIVNNKANYESQLKMKDEEIERYRDFKAKQSTKLIGESLEQHCEIEFNRHLRPILTKAYFEKDNLVSKESNSKGDFIYRDYDEDDEEFISIMFEMKNEADATEKKHKNEDFLKELDKDRNEKKCEYAVLVTMLEMDNELYNGGIVDMSHKYPKMYVIRPQFFISIITLLRNAALKSVDYRRQLTIAQNQNIDITNFEENINKFKDDFARNFDLASRKFNTAIEEIDKTISHLQKTKEALLSSDRNLRIANDKAQNVSIKKLTKNAPSVKEKFDSLKNK